MSLPSAVFLDTSVLAGQQYNFASTAIKSFIPLAKKHALKLILPDPTESEVKRQIRDRSKEALLALEDARRKAPFLSKWKHYPPKQINYLTEWEVTKVAMEEWNTFLANFTLERLDYSSVNLNTIMSWYDRIVPPFREGKKRKEFPDAFAIAVIEAYARKSGESIAVVSDDTDMKLACDRFSSLLYFKSLPALSELLLSDEVTLDKIRQAVLDDLSSIADAAQVAASELDRYHMDRNYKIERTNIHGVEIDEVSVVAIGHEECTLTFSGSFEAEHLLQWTELDHYREDYVEEEEWISELSPLNGTAKVALDPVTKAIRAVTFFDLDTVEIEVTEIPRRRR